ncbi:putative antitoxin YezG [compost metagenome]
MNKTEELYQIIGNKLVGIIPDDWEEIYLYAEILPSSRLFYFYFKSLTKDKLIYSQNIPEEYGVDRSFYLRLHLQLQECFAELNEEFKRNSSEPWTNLTMYINQSGKFKIDYSFNEILVSPDLQLVIWEYEVLRLYPTTKYHTKMLEDYLKEKR